MNESEEWKLVKNYPNYEVSNTGKVRSNKNQHNQIILKPGISKSGYARVVLCNDEGKRNIPIHRLVSDAFIPNPENKPQVNHKDGNKQNNTVENLEWVTPSENIQHSFDVLGKIHQNGGTNKLTKEQVEDLRRKAANGEIRTFTECAKEYGVSKEVISWAIKGTHGHYDWVDTVPPVPDKRDPGVKKKLTPDQVVEARKRFSNGESSGKLAKEFGMSQSKMYLVVTGKSYKNIPMDSDETSK